HPPPGQPLRRCLTRYFWPLRAATAGSISSSLRVVTVAPSQPSPPLSFQSSGTGSFQLYWALMSPPLGACERTATSISIWLTLAGTGSSSYSTSPAGGGDSGGRAP